MPPLKTKSRHSHKINTVSIYKSRKLRNARQPSLTQKGLYDTFCGNRHIIIPSCNIFTSPPLLTPSHTLQNTRKSKPITQQIIKAQPTGYPTDVHPSNQPSQPVITKLHEKNTKFPLQKRSQLLMSMEDLLSHPNFLKPTNFDHYPVSSSYQKPAFMSIPIMSVNSTKNNFIPITDPFLTSKQSQNHDVISDEDTKDDNRDIFTCAHEILETSSFSSEEDDADDDLFSSRSYHNNNTLGPGFSNAVNIKDTLTHVIADHDVDSEHESDLYYPDVFIPKQSTTTLHHNGGVITPPPPKLPKYILNKDGWECDPITMKPLEPAPEMCCGNDCPNCIWIQYDDQIHNWKQEQERKAKQAGKAAPTQLVHANNPTANV